MMTHSPSGRAGRGSNWKPFLDSPLIFGNGEAHHVTKED